MHKHRQPARPKVEDAGKVDEVFYALCESIDSPRSLASWLLFKNGEHDQLVDLEMDCDKYLDGRKFADDYLVTKFLSKFKHLKLSTDPQKVAWAKFLECEDICRRTNLMFRELSLDPSKWDPSMEPIFRSARRKVRYVLGNVNLDAIDSMFAFGPGATSATRSKSTSTYFKFKARLDVTSNALIMGHCCVNSRPAWVNCQLQTDNFPSTEASLTREAFSVVRGNEIVFVSKTAKTHRTIAIEPHVNSYLQKGFGLYIRKRLLHRAGIDLDDQSINQRLALQGSLYGDLATIDLSGASDTISQEIVRYMLPPDWFQLLDQIRSKQGTVRGSADWFYYEKFSSMGNGFTFELESLIFWALCRALVDTTDEGAVVSVYGDDLIVPSASYELLAKVISYAGFSINASKSFHSGCFRESCGKDYYLGMEVRPIFLKEKISNVEAVYKLANSIRRYSHSRCFNNGCDERFLSTWRTVREWVPTEWRFSTPNSVGDVGFSMNLDESCPTRSTLGWSGWHFPCIRHSPAKVPMKDEHARYTAHLEAAGSEEPLLGFATLRDKTFLKRARGYTLDWYDFGPWVRL